MLEKISPDILREKLGLIKWVLLLFFSSELEGLKVLQVTTFVISFRFLQACKFIKYTSSHFEESVWVSAPYVFVRGVYLQLYLAHPISSVRLSALWFLFLQIKEPVKYFI